MAEDSHHQSPYDRLGIAATASKAEIRAAYHAKALALHPDKTPASKREEATQSFKSSMQRTRFVSSAYIYALRILLPLLHLAPLRMIGQTMNKERAGALKIVVTQRVNGFGTLE
jgi:hypothetical protein